MAADFGLGWEVCLVLQLTYLLSFYSVIMI